MRHARRLLQAAKSVPLPVWAAMGAWAALFAGIGAWKYRTAQYRDLDLAYFTQVFWNTVHGRPFGLSLHPHPSLGDHAEWLVLPLSLLFAAFSHPVTLLALQALALAAGAIPLFRIAARRLPARWALVAALGYLLLAVPQNAALFEFHLLPFALPLLLAAADAYDRKDFRMFLVWIVLALAVREDVALAVVGFAAVAAFERRGRRWIAAPLLLAAAAVAIDFFVIRSFAVGGGYKFSAYYAWLGGGALARHLVSLPVLEFVAGLLMPFLLLPFVRPRWLLLAALPTLQIVLTQAGGGALALEMHYATLALPGVLLASLDGLATLLGGRTRLFPWAPLRGTDRAVLAIALGFALAASQRAIGPLPGVLAYAFRPAEADAAAARELAARVPAATAVAASDGLLPFLARRERVYALKYVFLGRTQYGAADYGLADPPEFLATDAREALVGAVAFPTLSWTRPLAPDGAARLRDLVARGSYAPVWQRGPFTLWQRGGGTGSIARVAADGVASDEPVQVGNAKVHALRRDTECGPAELCILLTVSLDTDPGEDLAASFDIQDADGRSLGTDVRLLGDQLLPTHEWPPGEPRTVTLRFLVPDPDRAAAVAVGFFRPRGALVMGPLRSSRLLLAKPESPGTVVPIE